MSKTKGSIVIKFSSLGLSLITIFLAFLFLFAFGQIQGSEKKSNYLFKENISRSVLENYLARSATVASLLHLALDDDLRMIQNTGVKFAGRVIWILYLINI